jgi:magnesium transporter
MTKKLMKKRGAKLGQPAGALIYVGDAQTQPHRTRVEAIDYDEHQVTRRELARIDECAQFRDRPSITWINVDELSEPGVVEQFGRVLGFHALMQEDILNTDQRAKVEDHGEHLYIVLKMLEWDAARGELDVEQLSLVLGGTYVITFQERAGDFFGPLRARLEDNVGRLRRSAADHLAYALLDLVIDHYFLAIEQLGSRIEAVDEQVMTRATPAQLREIHALRREMIFVRKAVWPVKEVITTLRHLDTPLIQSQTDPFLADLQDHIEQVIEGVDAYQNLLANTLSTHLSQTANRTNAVMRVLAVFSAVFMPLTFITGIFGMNFEHMAPLGWPHAFEWTLAAMGVAGLGLFGYFVRRGWL